MNNILKRFKYIIIIVLALTIFVISIANYQSTKEVIREKYESRQLMIERNILQTINNINDSYKIAEEQLNEEMREYSQVMINKYKNNPNVNEWDLQKLKERFEGYNIYIINDNLKVIRTTFEKDLGLDFSKYKSFAKILRDRLNGDTFVVDRLDLATQTGEIKKYSYMPTPDNKYLLELSINAQHKFPSLKNLDLFGDASQLTEEYNLIEEISFFSVEPIDYEVAKLRSSKKPYLEPDVAEVEDELARKAIINKESQSKTIKNNGNEYTYKFFPALFADREDRDGGWNSYVVALKYDNQVMQQEIAKHRGLFSLNIILMLIVFISFISVVVYLLNKFEYQAYHDQLTGLAGRKLFEEKFEKQKNKAKGNSNKFAILFLDIDKFKRINDEYGHNIGDHVLKNIAVRLKSNLKSKDCLARLGGDEFVIMIADLGSKEQAEEIGYRILKVFDEPIVIEGQQLKINISGGISIYPEDGKELENLIKNADYAMYQAKKGEKDLELKK
ncbi:MAG TPA: GGDEF domain-containing protein [Halanaerobiales bacterium]|nr:GGDEF domain-containing protein [Halanaerobiales bacterium]